MNLEMNDFVNLEAEMPTEETYGGEWEDQLLSAAKSSSDSTCDQINDEESDDEVETLPENKLTYTDVNDMLDKIILFAKVNDE